VRRQPSPLLCFHLLDLLCCYALALRLYNGCWRDDAVAAAVLVAEMSSVLLPPRRQRRPAAAASASASAGSAGTDDAAGGGSGCVSARSALQSVCSAALRHTEAGVGGRPVVARAVADVLQLLGGARDGGGGGGGGGGGAAVAAAGAAGDSAPGVLAALCDLEELLEVGAAASASAAAAAAASASALAAAGCSKKLPHAARLSNLERGRRKVRYMLVWAHEQLQPTTAAMRRAADSNGAAAPVPPAQPTLRSQLPELRRGAREVLAGLDDMAQAAAAAEPARAAARARASPAGERGAAGGVAVMRTQTPQQAEAPPAPSLAAPCLRQPAAAAVDAVVTDFEELD
jgi:hypothetical protein